MRGVRGVRSRSRLQPWASRPLILSLALVASAWPAGGGVAATLRLVPPSYDAHLLQASAPSSVLAGRGPARISIRAQTVVSGLVVKLNGKRPPTVRIVRNSRLRWTVILPGRALRSGLNQVQVHARAGRHSGDAFVAFSYLLPRNGLVQILAPNQRLRAHSVISQTFSVARNATVSAWLNGRSEAVELGLVNQTFAHGRFIYRFDAGIALGVHFGANRIVVQAQNARFYTRVVRRVFVTRQAPIIGAGTSQTIALGESVRLGTPEIRPAHGGALRFHWELYEMPRGSHARFSSTSARRPLFTPDKPGVYRLGLEVREAGVRGGGDSKQDVAISVPAGPLVQLQTEVTQDSETGISLGGTFYPGPFGVVQVFALDRSTLEMSASAGFSDMTAIGPWITQEQNKLGSPIVILQTTSGSPVRFGTPDDFNNALAPMGALPVWENGLDAPAPFVAIGVAGLPVGTATQGCAPEPPTASTTRCAINGWFSSGTSQTSHYTFSFGDFVPFSVTPSPNPGALTNTITVGQQQITSPPFAPNSDGSASLGGYHVVVLDRYTLQVLHNDSFATANDNGATAEQGMLDLLNSAVADDTQVVVITTVGDGFRLGAINPQIWTAIMGDISQLGGTPDVFARASAGQTYSLVGIANDVDYGDVAEASSVAHAAGDPVPTGAINGVLQRSRHDLFEPLFTTESAPNVALYQAIYRAPTSWPDSNRPDYPKASAWLAGELLPHVHNLTDVRDEYDSHTVVGSWMGDLSSTVDKLEAAGCPTGPTIDFSCDTVKALENDYVGGPGQTGEFAEVDEVNTLLHTEAPQVFNGTGLSNYVTLQTLESQIENAEPAAGTDLTESDIFAIMQGAIDVLSVFPETDEVLGVTSGLLGIAAGATSEADGAPEDTRIQDTASTLATDIVSRQSALTATFDTLNTIAVSDYGRLTAMYDLAENVNWDSAAIATDIEAGERQQIVTALTTATWGLSPSNRLSVPPTWITSPADTTGSSKPVALTDMRDWECEEEFGFSDIHPFNQMDPNSEHASIVGWANPTTPLYKVFFITGTMNFSDAYYGLGPNQCREHWPLNDLGAKDVFDAMFAPAGATLPNNSILGVGLDPAQWWWRNFSGTCWHGKVVGQMWPFKWHENCAPNPNSYALAPVWRH
jgi:hypothetical protein